MNAPLTSTLSATLHSSARQLTKLKAWRKAQMVDDPDVAGLKRAMRITDVPRLYGIGVTTWHQWEQPPGSDGFKCPNAVNMRRLCGEITKGAVTPADFYAFDGQPHPSQPGLPEHPDSGG